MKPEVVNLAKKMGFHPLVIEEFLADTLSATLLVRFGFERHQILKHYIGRIALFPREFNYWKRLNNAIDTAIKRKETIKRELKPRKRLRIDKIIREKMQEKRKTDIRRRTPILRSTIRQTQRKISRKIQRRVRRAQTQRLHQTLQRLTQKRRLRG